MWQQVIWVILIDPLLNGSPTRWISCPTDPLLNISQISQQDTHQIPYSIYPLHYTQIPCLIYPCTIDRHIEFLNISKNIYSARGSIKQGIYSAGNCRVGDLSSRGCIGQMIYRVGDLQCKRSIEQGIYRVGIY